MRIFSRICVVSLATIALAASGIGASAASVSSESGWTDLASGPEPESNPLKGFIPFAGDFETFPYSMEWSYLPLNAVMTGPNTFDWSALESVLNEAAGRGHQTALRFYLDYPTKESGIPQYLIDNGLSVHHYTDYGNTDDQSVSPNYDDPQLLSAIGEFVTALAARYDGDPRIGFLQAGLLGFWGEWHTYPHNGDAEPENWMASDASQLKVLQDFTTAFHSTELEVRTPTKLSADLPIGYHDDSFALETKQSSLGWHFMDQIIASGAGDKWKKYSIGGELRPELQSCLFSSAGCPTLEEGGDNDFAGSVEETHASWMINDYAFRTGYSSEDRARAIAAAQSLGYSFTATRALIPTTASAGSVDLGVSITNTGVASFYQNWPITIAFVDSTGTLVSSQKTDWHVSDIAAGSSKDFTQRVDTSSLPAGDYTVVMQVPNPMENGMPIRFANHTQDADIDGWLTLGHTTVSQQAVSQTPSTAVPAVAAATGPGTHPVTASHAIAASGTHDTLAATGINSSVETLLAGLGLTTLIAGIAALTFSRRRMSR